MEVDFVDDDEYAAIMMALEQAAAQKARQGTANQGQPRPNQMTGAQQAGEMHAAQQPRPNPQQQHGSQQQHTQQPQSHRPANLQDRNSGSLTQQQNRPSQQAGQTSIGNYFMNKGPGSTAPAMPQGTLQPAQVIDV
jgi:hypothetical protein